MSFQNIFLHTKLISGITLPTLALTFLSPLSATASVHIDSRGTSPIALAVEPSTGLSAIYVVESINGATAQFEAKNTSRPVWYTFGARGAAYAEAIPDGEIAYEGMTSRVALRPDCGFVVEDGTSRTYFWVVDYSQHVLSLKSLNINESESDCRTVTLSLEGNAQPIYYYTINGRRTLLSRELILSYNTVSYSPEDNGFISSTATTSLSDVEGTIHCEAPLCDTDFTLTGDRFLREWNGNSESVNTPIYRARNVDAHTTSEQTNEKYDNQQGNSGGSDGNLGGNAPADITFSAQVTPAAIFTEWQMSRHPEFETIDLRYRELEFTHTFSDAGTTFVRFVAANADGGCEYYSPTYQVAIGESSLRCPNAFSPKTSPGVNDEWKVSYKSIVEFRCDIFSRWGVRVASLDHPSKGWDGRHNGKYVDAGVYYYIIKAKGSDGRVYNLKGDINIIDYNNAARQTAQ